MWTHKIKGGIWWYNMHLFNNYATRSIFKEFPFFWTGCLTMAKTPSLSYYFTHRSRVKRWIHAFPKTLVHKGNTNVYIQNLKLGHPFHSSMHFGGMVTEVEVITFLLKAAVLQSSKMASGMKVHETEVWH